MGTPAIRWGAALGGAVLAEVSQIAATFAWVAIYSYGINPGHSVETYEQHAQVAGPWVSLLAGTPIFYLASRWIARSVPTATALFGVFVVIDGSLLLLAGAPYSVALLGMVAASFATKLVACILGGRHGRGPAPLHARS